MSGARLAILAMLMALQPVSGQPSPPVPLPPPPRAQPHPPALPEQGPPAARPGTNTPPLAPMLMKAGPATMVFDADSKEYTAREGETNVVFTFIVTNVSTNEITILRVQPSCGCSVAKVPPDPWKLAPGAHDKFEIHVDVRGKHGKLIKNVMITSTAGFKVLQTQVNLPPLSNPNAAQAVSALDDRVRNIHLAMADRQAVFKNDCARCHAQPAAGKHGQALYYAVCAICHEAAHRASMVPDLARLNKPTDAAYWRQWVADGKPGTLMPAFSDKADRGPLSDEQIKSLVDYLLVRFPGAKTAAPAAPAPPAVIGPAPSAQ